MDSNDLKDKAIQKVNDEYDTFIKHLKECEPEEIIDRAYEHVCKQEMLHLIEDKELSKVECKALLKFPYILQDCYDEWMKSDGGIHEILVDAVDRSTEHIVNDYERFLKSRNRESR